MTLTSHGKTNEGRLPMPGCSGKLLRAKGREGERLLQRLGKPPGDNEVGRACVCARARALLA